MSDTVEPPAKRARFNEPEGDIPGSPVDDLDDDFYDTTPVKPSPRPVDDGGAPSSSAPTVAHAAAGSSLLQLPGLGLLSNPFQQDSSVQQTQIKNEDHEDGELSDSESLYNGVKPANAPAAMQHVEGFTPAVASPIPVVAPTGSVADGELSPYDPALAKTNPRVKGASASNPSLDELEDGELSDTAANNTVQEDKGGDDNAKADFLRAAEANKDNKEAEWQLDSEASDSSSDSSSDDSEDGSEEGEDSDSGELLDPEEQVRRLMMEATDEPGTSGPAQIRTQNETTEQFEKPDIQVTETTKITELGKVESIVDNLVLIKAKTSGDYQVLESGSALCLSNRTVIGKVADTIGRVQEPRYSLGFSDLAEIGTLGIAKDTIIYYVDEHSKFVFTEPLKAQKFTDASNLYDEEANDVEFSDDEKEAEHKRKLKEAKRAKAEANRDAQDKPQPIPVNDAPVIPQPSQYQGGGLNYGSDDDEDFGMYKRLARPDHFEDIVGAGAPMEDRSHVRRGNMRGRGGWPDRGRGFRGRGGGGGGGGGRGNQRGGRFSGPSERGGRHQGPAGSERGGRHQGSAGPSERGGRHQGSGGPERGGRHQGSAGPPERGGRHQEHNRQRNEKRAAPSASPNRNHGRPPLPPQQSPPRGNSSGRKKNRRQHAASPSPAALPPTSASANANAFAHNAVNSNAWSTPNSAYAPAPTSHGYTSTNAQPIPAGAYVNPAFYGQPAQPAQPAVPQNQQQQNLAQWAQWFQLAAAMSQNQGQGQAQPPPATAPPPAPAPNYNAQPSNAQGGTPSLQDILRTLGSGSQPR